MSNPTAVAQPLTTWHGEVLRDWVDYNGHLRDAFYLLLFSFGTDGLMDRIGLDAAGRAATGHTMYTLECHLNFLLEVKQGTNVEVRTQILGMDNKRLHVHHTLHQAGATPLLAASEQMHVNIDTAGPRACTFAQTVYARVHAIAQEHSKLPAPLHIGRVIGLPPART